MHVWNKFYILHINKHFKHRKIKFWKPALLCMFSLMGFSFGELKGFSPFDNLERSAKQIKKE